MAYFWGHHAYPCYVTIVLDTARNLPQFSATVP